MSSAAVHPFSLLVTHDDVLQARGKRVTRSYALDHLGSSSPAGPTTDGNGPVLRLLSGYREANGKISLENRRTA